MPDDSLRGVFPAHHWTAWRIDRGKAVVDIRGVRHQATAGHWMVLPPGERSHHMEQPVRVWSVHFSFGESPAQRPFMLPAAVTFRASKRSKLET
ncbi:MAG: hypothetical protein SNJ84_05880, partial [Verrucomicrobiia bacterium]